MISTAPSLVRRSKTDRIGTMLKQKSGAPQIIMQGQIPDVGQFGTGGSLPTDSTPIDPPILTSGGPSTAPVAPDYWTRLDPNMGAIPPTVSIDPSQGSGLFPGAGSGSAQFPTVGVGAAGPFPGGNMGGPQGSVYGINPVTGNTIYNVTGSPRPGFFDSNVGKFVKGVGSTALNAFVPGLGFASGRVFDAIRRANERRNTGTDLSGRTSTGQNAPSGPTWFQPGYKLPTGIQDAIARGDYSRAYGPTANSLQSARIMASQAYGGNPNNARAFASEGRFLLDAEGAPRMMGQMYGDRRNEFRRPQGGPAPYASNQAAVSEWLRQQPAYIKFMQGRGG